MAFHSSFQNEKKLKIGGVIKNLKGKELKNTLYSIKFDLPHYCENLEVSQLSESGHLASVKVSGGQQVEKIENWALYTDSGENSTIALFGPPPLLTTLKIPYNTCFKSRIDPWDGSLDSGGDGEKLATQLRKTGNTIIFKNGPIFLKFLENVPWDLLKIL